LATEGVELDFTDDGIDELARLAHEVNSQVENIGARRLMTVMERVVDEISYTASDRTGETVRVDGAYVRERVADLVDAGDLSKFIL
jgi:ATP-dependent HslUV protease ATP-binding subunit HslU